MTETGPIEPARIAHGGDVHWFAGYEPGVVCGGCPHTACPHNAVAVIAWGPTFGRYELVECEVDGPDGCHARCRAWIDHRCRVTTAWLAIDAGPGEHHHSPQGSQRRTPYPTRSGAA